MVGGARELLEVRLHRLPQLPAVSRDDSLAVGAWLQERLEPFRRTLERLSPRARANFLEGWRILGEETARSAASESDAECADPT